MLVSTESTEVVDPAVAAGLSSALLTAIKFVATPSTMPLSDSSKQAFNSHAHNPDFEPYISLLVDQRHSVTLMRELV